MANAISFGGGALLGVASSLHCIGMCGGIALLLGMPGETGRGARALFSWLPLHGGRAFSYMMLGGLVGAVGGAALGAVQIPAAHLLARWAAAMVLAWLGLSTLGLMPAPALVGHALLPRFALPRGRTASASLAGRFGAGVGWGLMPCGMVYGALLYAAFAGSALGGLSVMAGFALGTVPALLLVHSGAEGLSRLARRPGLRRATGVAMLLLAAVSLMPDEVGFLAFCRGMGLPV